MNHTLSVPKNVEERIMLRFYFHVRLIFCFVMLQLLHIPLIGASEESQNTTNIATSTNSEANESVTRLETKSTRSDEKIAGPTSTKTTQQTEMMEFTTSKCTVFKQMSIGLHTYIAYIIFL